MNPVAIQTAAVNAAAPRTALVDAVYAKVTWRIMPLLVICYIVAFLACARRCCAS